ncbi:MAG: FtsX-like permease family protein [bacterium]|nr:FtsX-like permease family protein [bacterium]
MDTPGDRKYIYLFSTVAFLILIIASVNYVNLATSRASLRGKEVGIRKTVGALRTELMKQFLGESIMLTLFALSVSLIIVYMIHPLFQNFIGQNIPLDLLLNPVSLAGLFLLIFTVGFISGCYPSFLLSSFRPVNVLKPGAKTINVNNRFKLRNILVVFQFFVSVVLIVATLVINKQLSFIMNKDIGYQRENIITVRLWDSQNAEKFEIIKEELVRNSNIINVTVSDRAPLRASENNTVRVEDETSGEMVSLAQVSHFYVDHDFIDVYNMNVTDGRNFLKEFSTDEYQGVIVNRTLVNTLGLKNPIGKRFYSPNRNDARIIGVVEDFHFASFTYKIGAIVMMQRPQWGSRVMSLKVSDNDLAGTLDYIQSNFQGHIPDFVFSYEFLDDRFNSIYNTESRMGNLFTVFSMIALVIASVGLLGLISSIAAQKTKEIGIRKILGASVTKITGLVISEFVVLVIISSLIALPVSYFAMSNWLSDFAYRTDITIWTMLLSSLIAFIIAAISVIFQVVKAARANPVESMRYE